MALIGSIRKNGWILIVTMILALGGFILMDVVSNAQRYQQGGVNTLAKVNGTEIKRSDFDRYEKLMYPNQSGNTFQVRNTIWNYFVEKEIVMQEADEIGIGVPKDELIDLQFGANLSPVILERFRGDNGQVNSAQLAQVKQAIENGQTNDPQARVFWLSWAEQEHEIVKNRIQDKLIAAVGKGFFTPTWMAEMAFKENNERMDVKFVRIPYDKIKDDEAQVTDDDYKAYMKEYPKLYDQTEESRVIRFVTFDVTPTAQDSMAAKQKIGDLIKEFAAATNDTAFMTSHNGTYDGSYKLKAALPAVAADSLMSRPVGSVVGPYLDGDKYTIAKIAGRKTLPDSVRARHILIRDANLASENKIDSLKALIEKGAGRFDSLAVKNSQDPGSGAKGGDLGWFANGMMVAEFNEVCFVTGEQGKLYKVATQFGWHLIEITGKKFIKNETGVKALFLSERIAPSKTTQQAIKDKALALMQQAKNLGDLDNISGQQGYAPQNSPALKANDYFVAGIGSGEDAREVVRWAFEENTGAGDISKQLFVVSDAAGGFFDGKYVVAGLKSIMPKGAATLASLKENPEVQAKVKALKKGNVLKSKLQNPGDLAGLANTWGVKVDTVRGISFTQPGGEPKMAGVAFSLAKDAVSAPVLVSNSLIVLSPITDRVSAPMPPDLALFRRQVASSAANSVRVNLVKSMVKSADMVDNRSRFY